VEIQPREVEIQRLDLVDWDDRDAARPIAILEVECSAGTYVRALARDLGEAVGSAAYLGALARTASGPFREADAIPLDEIRAAAADGADGLRSRLRPIDFGLEAFPVVPLEEPEVAAAVRGQLIKPSAPVDLGEADHVRLMARDGSLVAIARIRGERVAPDKVFLLPASTAGGSRPPTADAALATELDPPQDVDPDPATPDDV
jgi:tRNA pseudouridine55 synthase